MSFRSEYIYSWYGVGGSYVRCLFRNGKILLIPLSIWLQFKDKILISSFDDIRKNYKTFLVKE